MSRGWKTLIFVFLIAFVFSVCVATLFVDDGMASTNDGNLIADSTGNTSTDGDYEAAKSYAGKWYYYKTLEEAIADSGPGKPYIYVLKDLERDKKIEIKRLTTIYFGGHSLTVKNLKNSCFIQVGSSKSSASHTSVSILDCKFIGGPGLENVSCFDAVMFEAELNITRCTFCYAPGIVRAVTFFGVYHPDAFGRLNVDGCVFDSHFKLQNEILKATGRSVVNFTNNTIMNRTQGEELCVKKYEDDETALGYAVAEPTAKIDNTFYVDLFSAGICIKNGDTIILMKDSSGKGLYLIPDDYEFKIRCTIDFNGHTFTCTVPIKEKWSSGPQESGFCFGRFNAVTLKNGTIECSDDPRFAVVVRSEADLTLDNMMIDGTNLTGVRDFVGYANYALLLDGNVNVGPHQNVVIGGGTVIKASTTGVHTSFAIGVDEILWEYRTYTIDAFMHPGVNVFGDIELGEYRDKNESWWGGTGHLAITGGVVNGNIVFNEYVWYNGQWKRTDEKIAGEIRLSVKGGIFNSSIDASFIPEGYGEINRDGKFIVGKLLTDEDIQRGTASSDSSVFIVVDPVVLSNPLTFNFKLGELSAKLLMPTDSMIAGNSFVFLERKPSKMFDKAFDVRFDASLNGSKVVITLPTTDVDKVKSIVHISDRVLGIYTPVKGDGCVSFETDHNSVYAILDVSLVEFDANGGKADYEYDVVEDGKLSRLPNAHLEGFIFDGWYRLSGEKVTTDTVFTDNEKVFAKWIEEPVPTPTPTPVPIPSNTADLAFIAVIVCAVIALAGLAIAIIRKK